MRYLGNNLQLNYISIPRANWVSFVTDNELITIQVGPFLCLDVQNPKNQKAYSISEREREFFTMVCWRDMPLFNIITVFIISIMKIHSNLIGNFKRFNWVYLFREQFAMSASMALQSHTSILNWHIGVSIASSNPWT